MYLDRNCIDTFCQCEQRTKQTAQCFCRYNNKFKQIKIRHLKNNDAVTNDRRLKNK